MVKENLKPIQKPIEIVQEIENKEPMTPEEKFRIINSFEERQSLISNKSKLSLAARNKIIKRHGSDYLSERAFNNDIALMEMYGPGFWDDIKVFVKPATSVALVAASVFPPTAPIAAPILVGVGTTGLATAGIGHLADNKGLKEFGADLVEIAVDAVEGQGASDVVNKLKK